MEFLINYGGWILTPVHIIVCLILIAVVLLQTGKGTDWASALGGGGSQTAFGPRGVENTLSRLTKIAAVVFMVTSLSLALLQTKQRDREGFGLGLEKAASGKKPAATSPSPVAAAPAPSEAAPAAGEPAAAPAVAPEATPAVPAASPSGP